MKQKLAVLVLAGFAAACSPKAEEPSQIVVEGTSEIEVMPDAFELTAQLTRTGENHAATIAAIDKSLSQINESMPQLEGLEGLSIQTSTVSLNENYDIDCVRNLEEYRDPDNICPVTGSIGEVEVTVKGYPAQVAGNALSLLTELGADSATLEGYHVRDKSAAASKAERAAFEDARARADRLADSADQKIVRVLKMEYGSGFRGPRGGVSLGELDEIIVTARKRVAPAQALTSLSVEPVKLTARVVVAFEIEDANGAPNAVPNE